MADKVALHVGLDARRELGVVVRVRFQKIDVGQAAPVKEIDQGLVETLAILEAAPDGIRVVRKQFLGVRNNFAGTPPLTVRLLPRASVRSEHSRCNGKVLAGPVGARMSEFQGIPGTTVLTTVLPRSVPLCHGSEQWPGVTWRIRPAFNCLLPSQSVTGYVPRAPRTAPRRPTRAIRW